MNSKRTTTISLSGLLAYILFIAVGLASMLAATRFWFAVMFLTYLGAVSFATVGAYLQRGPARAFWLGFAIFGWVYFYYGFHDQTDRMVGNPLIIVAQDLSETFLNWAQPELSRTLPRLPIVLPNSPMAVQIRAIHAEKVLQTMIDIGFASLGAYISQTVFGKSQQPIPT